MLPGYGLELSAEEAQFLRIESYHRERVAAIQKKESPLTKTDNGIFVLHLVPKSCVSSLVRLPIDKLIENAGRFTAPGQRYNGTSRMTVDGFLHTDGSQGARAYTQV